MYGVTSQTAQAAKSGKDRQTVCTLYVYTFVSWMWPLAISLNPGLCQQVSPANRPPLHW